MTLYAPRMPADPFALSEFTRFLIFSPLALEARIGRAELLCKDSLVKWEGAHVCEFMTPAKDPKQKDYQNYPSA